MSLLTIPTGNDPYSVQRTTLEGVDYVLSFDYSSRENVWYLTIADSSSNVLATGIKIVTNYPLTYRLSTVGIPPGRLFCWSKTEDDSPAGLDDLLPDGRCALAYLTSDEAV